MGRIVIDARELRTSTGRYVERLLYYLQTIDNQNDYVILLKPGDFDSWQPAAKNFEKLVCPYKEFSFGEQLGLASQLRSLKPDLVHFPMAQQPVFYNGKVVTTINDLTTIRYRNFTKNPVIFKIKQLIYGWLVKRVAKKSVRLLTYSQYVKDDVVRYAGINAGKVSVTPLAADKITVTPEAVHGLEASLFLLYVGRPMSHKNLERLVEAFAQLKTSHGEPKLVLAGRKDANYEKLEREVRSKKINGVVFTGYVSEAQLRWLYEHCEAYVFPSLSEGFGLPGLEAMAQGAPVASSKATCLPEVYGPAAEYFDPLDVNSIAGSIEKIINDKDLRQKLIGAGHKQVADYSWRRLAEQTWRVYQAALTE